jgi:hypothetical protein
MLPILFHSFLLYTQNKEVIIHYQSDELKIVAKKKKRVIETYQTVTPIQFHSSLRWCHLFSLINCSKDPTRSKVWDHDRKITYSHIKTRIASFYASP